VAVVVGGESGPGARPMQPAWARAFRDASAERGIPFLFKQWGEYGQVPSVIPGQLSDEVRLVGKRNAGRRLDGETHDGYPPMASALRGPS
jgi:protein gp37